MIENKEYKKEQQTLKRKKIAGYLGWYTLLFALVSAGVFVWFLENQKSFCWTTDASFILAWGILCHYIQNRYIGFICCSMRVSWNLHMVF